MFFNKFPKKENLLTYKKPISKLTIQNFMIKFGKNFFDELSYKLNVPDAFAGFRFLT